MPESPMLTEKALDAADPWFFFTDSDGCLGASTYSKEQIAKRFLAAQDREALAKVVMATLAGLSGYGDSADSFHEEGRAVVDALLGGDPER